MSRILLTADWHLRGDAPICRVDPDLWLDEQRQSVEQLYSVVDDYDCDEVWVIGDIFHRCRTSTEATVQALSLLAGFPCPVFVLPGNHDLLAHAYENLNKSTIGSIYSIRNVRELRNRAIDDLSVEAHAFGTEPNILPSSDIWCTHQLVFPDNEARFLPDMGIIAEDLLKCSSARIIITGDYHHGYVKDFGDTKVVTCGCLNIQASDMSDYKPRCYILDTEDLSVTEVPLKKFGKVHADPNREARQELETYMEGLQDFEVPHLDFIANVDKALNEEKDKHIRECVQDVLDTYNPDKS